MCHGLCRWHRVIHYIEDTLMEETAVVVSILANELNNQ